MRALYPFIKLFKQQWLMMAVGLLLSITTLLAGIGLLSLSAWFLSASAVAGLSLVTAQAFNYFTPAGGVRFLSIARTASRYGERLATHEATFKLLTQLRVWAWRKLLPLSARNMQGHRQGDILNRLVADIDTLDHLYLRLLSPMLTSLLMLGALYLFVSWLDAQLALVMCGSFLLAWLILPWLFYFLGRKPGRQQLESKREYRIQVLEFVQGMAELSLFGAQQRFREQLSLAEAKLFSSQRAMANVTALSQATLILCHGLVLIVILYMASSGFGDYQPPGAMLALIAFMALACIEMLMPIAGAFQHLSGCIAAATRVNELMQQQPDIVFNKSSQALIRHGSLQLQNICFSYEPTAGKEANYVLKDINLSITSGEKVALLGQTGCGKSTLLSLITRQWQPSSGQLLADGLELEQYTSAALSAGITLVSQRIYLFSGSLRSNLSLAQLTTAPQEQNDRLLLAVLKKVGLSSLTQGKAPLDVQIGEGGRQLSGGEQRRIGVARALLRDAPILLLDEPTEGLDKRTEREILALLLDFAKDKTLLMISHRLTAMAQMDIIYLMEDGQLRGSGSHDVLLEKDDYYASLHQQLH